MKAGLFQKKPIIVKAIRWSTMCDNADKVLNFLVDELGLPAGARVGAVIRIKTLEGVMDAGPGDFIIQGVRGEFYPCKPNVFAATYEPIDSAAVAMLPPHPSVACSASSLTGSNPSLVRYGLWRVQHPLTTAETGQAPNHSPPDGYSYL